MFSKDILLRVVKGRDCVVNSEPNNEILDRTKLNAFEEGMINSAYVAIFLCDKIENILGTRENAACHNVLKSLAFQGRENLVLCSKGLNLRRLIYINLHFTGLAKPG